MQQLPPESNGGQPPQSYPAATTCSGAASFQSITENADEVIGHFAQEPEAPPEFCCVCMGEEVSHTLDACGHSSSCGTCAMRRFSGAVSSSPQCPLCQADITGYRETPVASAIEAVNAPSAIASPPQPPADLTTSEEEVISPDVLNILRRTSTESGPSRTGLLLCQLQELRSSQQNFFTDFVWDRHGDNEPYILPDTGAKDGLRGDKWACYAGAWAATCGHKLFCDRLPERRKVSGVGAGTQHADDTIRIPCGFEDTSGKFHLGDDIAAVIRNSSLPALLGMDSLSARNAVIRCKTGEIWLMDKKGCDIKPKGNHVHLRLVKARSGHWYLPVGRFNNVMTKLGEAWTTGHDD